MIWWTLALFVISFLVTAVLAPKPHIEDARPSALNPETFPRATEDAPIPLVLGKVRFTAPNTIWYGDYQVVPLTETVRTGLFSKKRVTVAYQYYLGIDLALCMGPTVQLHEIYMDDTQIWSDSTSTTVATSGSVSATELFGGYKNGGGFSGAFTYYPGSFDQPVNSYVEGFVGSGNVPAYRGLSHIVFQACNIGESSQLRKVAFIISSHSNAIAAPNSGTVGGGDMNPMEALYQVMTDAWRGLGIAASLIDLPSFQAAATTLYNEGNGVSVLVTSSSTGKTIISEILRQIDGIMYQDPETGKFMVKLIRFDYDPALIPVYDEDDVIQIRNFTKTSWEDVISQVKVSFPQRDKESSAVAISMDQANANMIGRLKTSTLSFPFCYDVDTANKIASRERATSSMPLFRVTIEMNRNAYTLRPGDVFKLNWPEYGLSEAIFRVQKHDLGSLLDNKIVLECLQDSFAQSTVVFSAPVSSAWTPTVMAPSTVATFDLIEMTRFHGLKLAYPVADGKASVVPLALKPSSASTGFDLLVGATSGMLDVLEPTEVLYPATGVISTNYPATVGLTGIDATGFTINSPSGVFNVPTTDELTNGEGGLLYINGEWMSYTGATGTTSITVSGIRRGLFGTTPKDHTSGTRIWHVTSEHFGEGTIASTLGALGTAYYKILDRVGPTLRSAAVEAQQSRAMSDVANRPARPRNVQISASRTPTVNMAVDRPVTWVSSNRNATTVTYEQDAAQTPDQTETYDVEVYFGGVLQSGLTLTGVASGTNVAFSTLSGPLVVANAEARVTSRRIGGDTKSSAYYASLPFSINIP
jgi:hypothetical protein